MKKVDYKTVEKQARVWKAYYQPNNERGKREIAFTQCGDQWDNSVIGDRIKDNKESLTFNLSLKHLKRLKSQNRQVELSLDITPTTKEWLQNVEETNVFRLVLQNGMLNTDMRTTFANVLDKCGEYGYSWLEASYRRQDETTLCLEPWFKMHKDPAIAFWDINAQHPCKIDGRFCGLERHVSKEEFLAKFPQYSKDSSWLDEKDNCLIDYWYRDYKEYNFTLLKSGIYRREDMLTPSDEVETNLLETDDNYDAKKVKELIKKGDVCCIYYMRFCNEKVIQKAVKYPTQDLPIPYHPAFTVWRKEEEFGEQTFPYTFHLRGAQQLHNFVNSQTATQAKKIAGDKWFTTPANADNKTKLAQWKNINKIDGTFIVNDIEKVRREQPAELSQTLMAMSQQTKQEIDEIAGAMSDNQNSDSVVVAGVAIDKITHNMQLQNVDVLAAHILFVNVCANLYCQMLPNLYTEQRAISVSKQDGTQDVVFINEYIPETQTVRNNIKDFANNFKFTVKGGPTSEMQKDNIRKSLTQVYQIDPMMFKLTADIYFRNMGSSVDGELERRALTQIPPELVQFSQGEINRTEYDKIQAQQAEQQKQAQMEQMQNDPQFKAMIIAAMAEATKAQAEQSKAQTAQFTAETNRVAAEKKSENDAVAQQVDLLVAMNTNDRAITEAEAEDARTIVDSQKELTIHNDKMNLEHKKLEVQKTQKANKNAAK